MRNRIISGTTMAIAALAIIFLLPAWTHLILLFAVFALAQMEFNGMVKHNGHRYELIPTTICGVAYLILASMESPVFYDRYPIVASLGNLDMSGIVLCITPAILLVCGVLRRETENAMETFALSYAGFWYIAVLLSFMVRVAFEWNVNEDGVTNYTGRLALLAFIAMVKMSDVGAYATGSKFGKRQLIPEISPRKTVEGLFGGFLFAGLTGLAIWAIAYKYGNGKLGEMNFPLVHALILPVVLTVAGVMGDLAESLIKRSVNVKDSGGVIPGIGGMLDVLDSLLFASPIMYIYIVLFLK